MAFKTLSQLRTLVRQAADIENDGNHTTDAEVDSYINQAIEQLHSLLVDGTDGALFATNAGELIDIGGASGFSYQLPGDFGHLISLDIKQGSQYIRSFQADPQDYAQLSLNTSRHRDYKHFLRWNVDQGRGELFIFPKPTNLSDIAVQYVREAPFLSVAADTLNWPSFWYQWCVYTAAIKCNIKEESDPSPNLSERERVEKRLRDHIRSMTPTRVKTIRNVTGTRGRFTPPDIHGGG